MTNDGLCLLKNKSAVRQLWRCLQPFFNCGISLWRPYLQFPIDANSDQYSCSDNFSIVYCPVTGWWVVFNIQTVHVVGSDDDSSAMRWRYVIIDAQNFQGHFCSPLALYIQLLDVQFDLYTYISSYSSDYWPIIYRIIRNLRGFMAWFLLTKNIVQLLTDCNDYDVRKRCASHPARKQQRQRVASDRAILVPLDSVAGLH